MDLGELESLAHLVEVEQNCLISSGDKIVWRTLGWLNLGDQGLSLEEILSSIGLGSSVGNEYSKQYREHWTSNGFQEGFQARP